MGLEAVKQEVKGRERWLVRMRPVCGIVLAGFSWMASWLRRYLQTGMAVHIPMTCMGVAAHRVVMLVAKNGRRNIATGKTGGNS